MKAFHLQESAEAEASGAESGSHPLKPATCTETAGIVLQSLTFWSHPYKHKTKNNNTMVSIQTSSMKQF